MELEPIVVNGPVPEPIKQLAQVWPEKDPPPSVGQERLFVLNGSQVRLRVQDVMHLGGGYVGVTMEIAA